MRVPVRLGSAIAVASAAGRGCHPVAAAGPRLRQHGVPGVRSGGGQPAPCSCRPTTRPATRSSPTTARPTACSAWRAPTPPAASAAILAGSVVDQRPRRARSAMTAATRCSIAVNAGSDTISVFAVSGDRLALRQVLGSGGDVPGQRGRAREPRVRAQRARRRRAAGLPGLRRRLSPIPGSAAPGPRTPRPARSSPTRPGRWPSPRTAAAARHHQGQRATTSTCSASGPAGTLSAAPIVNSWPGTVPFAVSVRPRRPPGHRRGRDRTRSRRSRWRPAGRSALLDAAATGQTATCWIGRDGPLPVRLQRRERRRSAASPPRPAAADAAREHADRRRYGGRDRRRARPVPVRADRQVRDRG